MRRSTPKRGRVAALLGRDGDHETTFPWEAFLALIEPVYHKPSSKGGRPPIPLEVMLRIHLLQQWFTLSDPQPEEMLLDTPCFRRFAKVTMGRDAPPPECTTDCSPHSGQKTSAALTAELRGPAAVTASNHRDDGQSRPAPGTARYLAPVAACLARWWWCWWARSD